MPESPRRNVPFGGEAIGIIPARCASIRFPDKPLALINGIPMICWTLHRASQSSSLSDVFVAAEDEEIVEAVQKYGGKARIIKGNFKSGSDRVASAARDFNAPAIVNIQADEPLIDPATIDEALRLLEKHPEFGITTGVVAISSKEEYLDPNCVKVVMDSKNRCLYFSRSPIPYQHRKQDGSGVPTDMPLLRHIGLYCFRRSALERYAELPPSVLEGCEGLEQLRYLESGGMIGAVEARAIGPGVDTIEDLHRVEEYINRKGIIFDQIS